jgi:hypothetical protein
MAVAVTARHTDGIGTQYFLQALQTVTTTQNHRPGGISGVRYVEVAGHEYGVVFLLFVMRDLIVCFERD